MRTLLPPIAGTMVVFLIALIAFVWRQNHAIEGLHAQIRSEQAAAQLQHEELQRLRQEHARVREDDAQAMAQLQRELAVARAAAGLELERNGSGNDPEMAEFRQREQRRIVQERYGDLFQRLNLPQATLEEFKRLLVELESSGRKTPAPGGTTAAADGPETSGADAAGSASTPRTARAIHHEIYTLLGYDNYAAFERFGRELTAVRPLVRRFASDAADQGFPLSAVQRSALSRVIFEATDPQVNPDVVQPGANQPDAATGLSAIDQLVLARATDVLSAAQLELLRAFRIGEREGLAVWRRSINAAPAAPAPALEDPAVVTSP